MRERNFPHVRNLLRIRFTALLLVPSLTVVNAASLFVPDAFPSDEVASI